MSDALVFQDWIVFNRYLGLKTGFHFKDTWIFGFLDVLDFSLFLRYWIVADVKVQLFNSLPNLLR